MTTEWKDKGSYLKFTDSSLSYKIFKAGKLSPWILQISSKDNPIPEQRFFYSKTAAINHANILIASTDPAIFDKEYTGSGNIKGGKV